MISVTQLRNGTVFEENGEVFQVRLLGVDTQLGEHVGIASMAWLGDDPTDVFNFEVEPQHSYLVAGGIVVHNVTQI